MKVVLILLDAFRSDYLTKEDTPFLYSLAQEGHYFKEIVPSHGYCERTEILTGLNPKQSGFFTAIGFNPQSSPYKDKLIIQILGFFEKLLQWNTKGSHKKALTLYRKIVLRLFSRYFNKFRLRPYNIPFSFLKYFDLTEDKQNHEDLTFFHGVSIYSLLAKNDRKYYSGAFTGLGNEVKLNDIGRLKIGLDNFKLDNIDFVPIYLSYPDSYGHRFGPKSKEVLNELIKYDILLREYVHKFNACDPNTVYMFLGDHGMSEIDNCYDIEQRLVLISKKNGYKIGKDFIYFLDSTMLRIWFFNEKVEKELPEIIRLDEFFTSNGLVLDSIIAEKYNIPFTDRQYGDFIWWIKDRKLIFPDFFHATNPYKGMHGYIDNGVSTRGTLIISGKNVQQNLTQTLPLHKVYELLKYYLKIE